MELGVRIERAERPYDRAESRRPVDRRNGDDGERAVYRRPAAQAVGGVGLYLRSAQLHGTVADPHADVGPRRPDLHAVLREAGPARSPVAGERDARLLRVL